MARTRFLAMVLLCGALAAHAEMATIHLTDGSTIVGEVRSLKGGLYTIVGPALGTIAIPQDKIRLVQYGDAAATISEPSAPSQAEIESASTDLSALQSQMLSNPEIMTMIQSLQNDPELRSIATDPDIQRAIRAGDYSSLMQNPKVLKLMNHSTVKAISREVQR